MAYGWSVEEVSLAGMPKPSLQGRIHGVFRNRLPIGARVVILSALENLAARNSRLIETYHILTNAYGIFWCYCFAKL